MRGISPTVAVGENRRIDYKFIRFFLNFEITFLFKCIVLDSDHEASVLFLSIVY